MAVKTACILSVLAFAAGLACAQGRLLPEAPPGTSMRSLEEFWGGNQDFTNVDWNDWHSIRNDLAEIRRTLDALVQVLDSADALEEQIPILTGYARYFEIWSDQAPPCIIAMIKLQQEPILSTNLLARVQARGELIRALRQQVEANNALLRSMTNAPSGGGTP